MVRSLLSPLLVIALAHPGGGTSDPPPSGSPPVDSADAPADAFAGARGMPLLRSALSTMFVKDDRDRIVARVEDLVIEPRDGVVVYAAISFSRVVDVGDVLYVVPWEHVEPLAGSHELRLTIAPDLVKAGPKFESSSWPNFADREFRAVVDRHYAGAGTSRRIIRARPILR